MDDQPTLKSHYPWLSLAAMIVFGMLNVVFSYLNWQERSDMRQEQRMTRTMLNARGTIQLILIEAAKADRSLTSEEIRMIDRLYVPAEYDIVGSQK